MSDFTPTSLFGFTCGLFQGALLETSTLPSGPITTMADLGVQSDRGPLLAFGCVALGASLGGRDLRSLTVDYGGEFLRRWRKVAVTTCLSLLC
jgi:hypothetical protein